MTIWQLFTDLKKEKHGPAVYLSLSGRARDCVRDLKPEEIGVDGGVKKITDKLDVLFLKDANTRAFLAFTEFYDYRRPSGVSITDFLGKFDYLYSKLGNFDVELPEGSESIFHPQSCKCV